jgi:hypothetical protein
MKKLIFLLFSLTLFYSSTILADELGIELIKEMKTFYINDCKEEAPVGVCECLFDSLIDAELTKEELLGTDLTFDYRKAKGIPETQLSEDKNLEIMEIMFNSMGACF